MLKKILLLLLCTNLRAVPQPESNDALKAALIAGAIWLATAAYSSSSEETSSEDARELLIFGKACISAAIITASVHTATQLYSIGKEIYEAIFPTEEQKIIQEAKTIAAHERLMIVRAEEALINCLMPNIQMRTSGMPTECEEAARLYELMAGAAELNKITKVFNKR